MKSRGVENSNPVAANQFIDLLFDKFDTIATQPLMGQSRNDLVENLRSFPVGNYLIFYRPCSTHIEILRVLSGYRSIKPSLFAEAH